MSGVQQQGLGVSESRPIDSVEEYQFEPIKGFPMLRWDGKRPFRSTRFYPAQLKEVHGQDIEGWRNRIYWGDNLQVMSHLLKQFRGQVKLVYIDPPFDSKADYKLTVRLRNKEVASDSTAFEEKQYQDIWANDDYLQFIFDRIILVRELLASDGALYVHCDWHKSHYIRLILDDVFGRDCFRNDITWVRSTNPKGSQHKSNRYDVFTDTILFYALSSETELNLDTIRTPLTAQEKEDKYYRTDEKGRYYDGPIVSSLSMGPRPTLVYEYKGYVPPISGWRVTRENLERIDHQGNLGWTSNGQPFRKLRPEDDKGKPVGNFWNDISLINSQAVERLGYPTQKPEALLERIVKASTVPGDLVFDCFMGSGTTQAVAMKLGRRFIGADINLGAVQITTKRLLQVAEDLAAIAKTNDPKPQQAAITYSDSASDDGLDDENGDVAPPSEPTTYYTSFEVYNVNYYDVFRNPVQAKDLLLQALEVQPLAAGNVFDGTKDGRMVKVMSVNRIATRADLNDLLANIDHKAMDRLYHENPNRVAEKITLVCMGHEPDLAARLKQELHPYKVDVEVVDVLRDRQDLQFKRDSEARVKIKGGNLVIEAFYPLNLLQKLSMQKEAVENWRELVESVMIDWNYDGAILTPALVDIPERNEMVNGTYKVPDDAGTIRVKITDLLSESWEGIVTYG